MPDITDSLARLEMNARHYTPDPTLDRVADLLEADDEAALDRLPFRVRDQGQIHRDFRDYYRAAVAAGAIPDRYPNK